MAEVFNFYVQDNRTILFPKNNLLEPIMQEDKDVAIWRFRIPKVLNEIDMSGWAWWFVYVNAKGQKFSELLTLNNDIDDPENFSTADYSIGYGISKTPGGFTFALEAINTSQGGEISGEWHTRTYTHIVTPTLQGNQAEYAETESDVISALMQEVRTRMNQVIGGATPLPVNLKSLMTDHDKVYLYTGTESGESTGYWYYWNGTAWAPGGQYGAGVQIDPTLSQSGQAADAKETGNALLNLVDYGIGDISIDNLSNGYISASGVLTDDGICKTTDYFVFAEGMSAISLLHCATSDASWCAISYYDKDKNFLSRTVYAGSATRTGQAYILSPITGSSYARVSFRTYTGWSIQLKYLKTPINRLAPKKIDRIEFVQGGLNGIEYNTYQPQRVATLETARYDKDIVVYLPKGHKMAYRSVVNGAQGFDSGWKLGFMYIPARTDFLMLLAKETEDTNVADVAEFTSGMMICDKYSENPTFVHGSLSSGAYTSNEKRIVNVSYFKFDKMCKITPKSGYSVSITEYRNDEFFYNYYWRDVFYMPAGATFRIVVKKNDDSKVQLSDDCFDIEPCDEESVYSNLNGVNHRGFWTAPENTIPAFALSKENGFHFVETDIALTSDGVPVLLHDESINRTARNLDYSSIASTINIAAITYEQALGYTFNGGMNWYREYIPIPTLAEFLSYCKLNSIHAYLELKTAAAYTDSQLKNIVDLVKMHAMWESVTWISFNTSYINKIKAIDASARLGYIVTSFDSSDISIVQGLGDNAFLDAQHEYITDELAQSCANAGIRLEAWSTSDVKLSELNKYVSRFTNNRWHN